jgi:hypothetical protein
MHVKYAALPTKVVVGGIRTYKHVKEFEVWKGSSGIARQRPWCNQLLCGTATLP